MNRGNKLWAGHRMILPQYVEALQEAKKKESPPTEFDEQWKEEMDRMLEESKERRHSLRMTVRKEKESLIVTGVVERIDPRSRRIQIRTREKQRINIPFHQLQDLQWDGEL